MLGCTHNEQSLWWQGLMLKVLETLKEATVSAHKQFLEQIVPANVV